MKVSKKYIISIWEFMENYVGVVYDGKYKLTHNEMRFFLNQKNCLNVKRGSFKSIKKEQLLNGDVVLVRDEVGNVVPYFNPRRSKKYDLDEINSIKNYSVLDCVDDIKDIGRIDYYNSLVRKDKILSKKKRVLRRKYD